MTPVMSETVTSARAFQSERVEAGSEGESEFKRQGSGRGGRQWSPRRGPEDESALVYTHSWTDYGFTIRLAVD
ncbi:MAG: hypothetical protein ABS43_12670 [Bordetella sp. SCN 67-23]|nr:MAG: hypothetical protein ABS43_12670 [Bordetella sp. SCN 67-23]OJW89913.1 MAG: hypothetical protein BGO71_26645 [Burkholderiales bacterium 67-32]